MIQRIGGKFSFGYFEYSNVAQICCAGIFSVKQIKRKEKKIFGKIYERYILNIVSNQI